VKRRVSSRPALSKGVALLEALVGILILAVGILGLVGLQLSMTRAQTSGKFRSDAGYLASELVGAMWGDFANLNQYTIAGCAANARCTNWTAKVAKVLPGGTGTVATDISGNTTITISWSVPGEGAHQYTTTTNVQR